MAERVPWLERITVNPEILLGKPIIRGTRISVEHALDVIACGWSMEGMLQSYRHLSREDILAAVVFAAESFAKQRAAAIQKVRG